MKRVVITGATSLIGRELVKICVNNGIGVLAVVRPNSVKTELLPDSALVKVFECDINALQKLTESGFVGADVFFHFAWQGVYGPSRDDVFLQNADITNTLVAVQTAKQMGCKKFVGAGSQAELGIINEKIGCDTKGIPFTPYGIAKNAAFKLSKLLAEKEGIEFNWGRILSIYGPFDASYTMVMTMLNKMLRGEECSLTSGEQIWDFLYSEDAARAFYLIGQHGINGKSYPIGSGEGVKLKEYILEMYRAVANDKAVLNFGAMPIGEKTVKYLCADMKDITQDTGFTATVSFPEGIRRVIESMK